MKPELIQEKLTNEIIQEFCLPYRLCHDFIFNRMQQCFGAGYDTGRKKGGSPRSIIQLTKEGKVIKSWENISTAARALGIERSHISKCAKGHKHHNTAGGYRWRYAY